MKVLYVYAHPEPKSFNGALKDTALAALKEKGHEVKLSDLYAMNFNPVLSAGDFTERKKLDVFKPFFEAIQASKTGAFAPDIKEEMDKVLWADLIIFQFPIWWSNFPAILKGWIDRVLFNGFAFNLAEMKLYDNGPLKGKKGMFSFTTGAPRELYSDQGPHGEIEILINYFNHILFEFVGMEALPYFGVFGPGDMSEEEREQEIERFQNVLKDL